VIFFIFPGSSVPVIFIIARNTQLPTDEGYVCSYCCHMYTELFLICRERIESFILSSQISNQTQTRTDLGNETVLLSFNIGLVSVLCRLIVMQH